MTAEEALRRELERSRMLQQVAAAAASCVTLEEIGDAVIDAIRGLDDFASGSIAVRDGDELRLVASSGLRDVEGGTARGPLEGSVLTTVRAFEQDRRLTHEDEVAADRARVLERTGIEDHRYAVLPARHNGLPIGTVALVFHYRRPFRDDELETYETVADILGQAMENARLFSAERAAARNARVLNAINQTLLSTLTIDEMLERIVSESALAAGARAAIIVELDGEELFVRHATGFSPTLLGRRFPLTAFPAVATAIAERKPRFVEDALHDPTANSEFAAANGDGSFMALPLVVAGKAIGALSYTYSEPRRFDEADAEFANALAHALALALENARLYAAEHGIAETLQETLLVLPARVPGVSFSRAYESATYQAGRVGGDFVDIFEVHGHLVGITLGDVSGKGIDAAVTTSLIRNTLRVHAVDGLPPAEVAAKANKVMSRFTPMESFVTLWFGLLNTRTGLLRYVSAGHPPALVMSAEGVVRELECRDPILGAFDEMSFFECRTLVGHGDRLLLYSDGVTEARSPSREFLGAEGLFAIALKHGHEPTTTLSQAMMNDVVAFGEGVLRDDAAILAVEAVKLRHRSDDGQLQAFPLEV